jgi:hypothetical protein
VVTGGADDQRRRDLERMYKMRSASTSGSGGGGSSRSSGCLVVPLALLGLAAWWALIEGLLWAAEKLT